MQKQPLTDHQKTMRSIRRIYAVGMGLMVLTIAGIVAMTAYYWYNGLGVFHGACT